MPWQLHSNVSFCRLDGRLIFLDIQKDRYFQLSEALERIFLAHCADSEDGGMDISALVERGILTHVPADAEAAPAQSVAAPARSSLECNRFAARLTPGVMRDVLAAVLWTQFQLKTRSLKHILDALAKYRYAKAPSQPDGNPHLEQRVAAMAVGFKLARPYVPVGTCCLLDSISMVRYLAKRGFSAQLVFGVACDPFSAHSWVQCGDIVVNDTVGAARAHVPIRVI